MPQRYQELGKSTVILFDYNDYDLLSIKTRLQFGVLIFLLNDLLIQAKRTGKKQSQIFVNVHTGLDEGFHVFVYFFVRRTVLNFG